MQVAKHFATLPVELQQKPQWVCWCYEKRDGQEKPTKVPYTPTTGRRASSTNPAQWSTFLAATKAYSLCRNVFGQSYDGIGFVLDNDFTVIDLDHCRNKQSGVLTPFALSMIRRLSSYSELSPSQEGIHIIVKGTIPSAVKDPELEMYCHGRFITMTGLSIAEGAKAA